MSLVGKRHCRGCGEEFQPTNARQRHCNGVCSMRYANKKAWIRNREREIQRNKEWRAKNRDRKLAYQRLYAKENRENIRLKNRLWGQRNLARRMLTAARQRARDAGLTFNIDLSDIAIPPFCPALGLELQAGNGARAPNSPTLDRLDNSRGYVKGNVRVISWRANAIKNNCTIEELEKVLAYMKAE